MSLASVVHTVIEITTDTVVMPNTCYVCNSASLITLTLSATNFYAGCQSTIIGKGTGGWKLLCASGQSFEHTNENIDSVAQTINYNGVATIVCTQDNTKFKIINKDVNTTPLGGRGINAGGTYYDTTVLNSIEYISISTAANGTDFGDLAVAKWGMGSFGSSTRGYIFSGHTGTNVQYDTTMVSTYTYITYATTGNATDFSGYFTAGGVGGASNNLLGYAAGGTYSTTHYTYVTMHFIPTLSAAVGSCSLTTARRATQGTGSSTRVLFAGGRTASTTLTSIEYLQIGITGSTAASFGNLSVAKFYSAAGSSGVRAVFGGSIGSSIIDYVTIATTSSASTFGNSSMAWVDQQQGCASPIRCLFCGGYQVNTVEMITFATTGNATDFADLVASRALHTGMSSSHGGLQI